MSTILSTSEEKTNGTKLARLLIDGGTHILRTFFHSIHPRATLQVELKKNFKRLKDLKSRRILFDSQWKQLFPPSGDPPDTETFDITLLHLLLREICNLKKPLTGWHNLPADSDFSLEANIIRIKCFRNELCHSDSTDIPNLKFENKWNKIAQSLEALGLDPLEINRLKFEPIDHDTESRVEEEVKKWKLDIEPRIESLEQDFKQMQREISSIQQSVSEETILEIINRVPDEVLDVYGRSQVIQQVSETIQTGQVAAVVITGGPGFGKSTVANKVAHKLVANRECKRAVLFCSLRSKTTIIDVATTMILACSNNLSKPPENPAHWLRNWSKQQTRHVTFVLDNADDILESEDHRTHFVSILCDMRNLSGHNVNFVITSRKAFKDSSLKTKEVTLNSLSPEDAKKVILSQVTDRDIQQKLSKTEGLVELCGYLPLALRLVGSLLSDYYTEDELIESLKAMPLEVLREDESDGNSVEKAIKTSFDLLSKTEQEALVLMSVFPGSFNANAAKAVMAPCMNSTMNIQPLSVLRSLKNRSLVQQPASYRYEIHPLIQSYAKKVGQEKYPLHFLNRGEEMTCVHFISRLADNADMYWSKDKCKESLQFFNEDRHNFEYFLHVYVCGLKQQVPNFVRILPETLFKMLWQKCLYLGICLLPIVFTQLLEDLLHLPLPSGEHHSKKVELLCLLGHESRKVGNRGKFKECLEEAIKEHSRNSTTFATEKVSEAFFFCSYGRFLIEEERFDDANEKFAVALKICEEHLHYVQKAATLNFAGRKDIFRNKRDSAEKKLTEALNLLRQNLGNHVLTAEVYFALADFHLFDGEKRLRPDEDRQKSIKLNTAALEMMENLGMKDDKECLLMFTNLGICYQFQGDVEEAMKLYQKSLNIADQELEDDHRWKIYVKTQMAFLWWKEKGNMEKAKALREEAMQMSTRLGLPDNQPPNKFLLQKF